MGLFQAFDISANWNDSRTLSYGHDRTEYCKYKYNEDGRRYTISERKIVTFAEKTETPFHSIMRLQERERLEMA